MDFLKWKRAVDRRLEALYAITIADAGIDDVHLTTHWEAGQPPDEFVEWFGNKYDLDRRSSYAF
ncbi:hypothetical protein HUU61_01335 [Rhodopseudomonas palustris]|nr:hypothetical protein [Rhodopseudomonas palustris]